MRFFLKIKNKRGKLTISKACGHGSTTPDELKLGAFQGGSNKIPSKDILDKSLSNLDSGLQNKRFSTSK